MKKAGALQAAQALIPHARPLQQLLVLLTSVKEHGTHCGDACNSQLCRAIPSSRPLSNHGTLPINRDNAK